MQRTTELIAKVEVSATITVTLNHREVLQIAESLERYGRNTQSQELNRLSNDFRILARQMKESLVTEGLKE